MTTTVSQQVYGKSYGGNAAENYERFFVPAIGAPLAADLVADAKLRPGERVLDVACGTGIVARLAAERVAPGGSVAGADVTAGMLAVARVAATASIPIRWYETSAEAIQYIECTPVAAATAQLDDKARAAMEQDAGRRVAGVVGGRPVEIRATGPGRTRTHVAAERSLCSAAS